MFKGIVAIRRNLYAIDIKLNITQLHIIADQRRQAHGLVFFGHRLGKVGGKGNGWANAAAIIGHIVEEL